MIFPVLKLESKIQVGEKTRLSGIKSYTSQDEAAVSLVRIKPSAGDNFITVSALDATDYTAWFLDWQYAAAGTQTITLEITTNGAPVTTTGTIEVVTSASEKLFSTDADIITLEPDALEYCKDGKNSLNDYHRQAQSAIMDEIYRNRIFTNSGDKLTVAEVVDVAELKFWSMYMVLNKVYQSMSNKIDDVFAAKSLFYAKKEFESMQMAMNQMRLDYDKSGTIESTEQLDFRTVEMIRR